MVMIVAHFDQGWKHVKASELQDNIVKSYLKEYFEDSSRTVLINNTWFNTEFCPHTREYLGEGNSFKNKITEYIDKHKHSIDNIVVYCLVDPPYNDPLEGIDTLGINVRYMGYYDTVDLIDLWALMSIDHFKNQSIQSSDFVYPFMCLNGKPHHHREELVSRLIKKDLIKNNLVSFGGNEKIPKLTIPENIIKNNVLSHDPYDAMSLGDITNWNHHFLNVVTETVFDVERHFFWSEKIFKPIIGKRPFIVYAPNGAEKILDRIGIKNYLDDFHDICDLDLRNPDNIPEFLEILNKQSSNYFEKKYISLLDKINYNANIIKNWKNSIKLKLNQNNNDINFLIEILNTDKIKEKVLVKSVYNNLGRIQKFLVSDPMTIFLNIEFPYYSDAKDLNNYDRKKYLVVSSSNTKDLDINQIFYPFHMEFVTQENYKKPIIIPKTKPFLFDALLGLSKDYRIDLFERLSPIIENGLVSISKCDHYQTEYRSKELNELEVENFPPPSNVWSSMTRILNEKKNKFVPASQIIPRKIYENSWISIVSETFPNLSPYVPDDVFFPTEKIAKPIAAGRIFMVSTNKGFLKELRNLGFKTFGDYIDESYDDLETYQERNQAIVKELTRLQEEVDMCNLYQKLLPVIQHNQDLIYSGKLQNRARLEIVKFLKDHS